MTDYTALLESKKVTDLKQETDIVLEGQYKDAYDAMMEARSCELDGDEEGAVDAWCEVFGEAFRTLSEETEE